MFLSADFMYLLSASFKVYLREGIWYATLVLIGGVLVNTAFLAVAWFMGTFKDRQGDKLRAQLREREDFEEEVDGN